MKKNIFILAVAIGLVLSSCCTVRTVSDTRTTSPEESELMADLDIRENKITHTYTTTIKYTVLINEEALKRNAVYEALAKIGADVLVAPQFMVKKETCSFRTDYEIIVTGYPAYYTNMREKPKAEKVEMRELKEGATYVMVKKTADNKDVEISTELIIVPTKDGCKRIDLNNTDLDHVVLKGK